MLIYSRTLFILIIYIWISGNYATNAPTILNDGYSTTFTEAVASSTELVQLITYDADGDSLTTTMITVDTKFSFDGTTLNLTVASSLPAATYPLTFKVADTSSLSSTATVTIIIVNSPPDITSLPTAVSVRDDETPPKLLHTIVETDASASDTVTCTLSATSPATTNFEVSGKDVNLKTGATLDYASVKKYKLTIQCDDTKDSVSEYLFINVVKNQAPTISNLPISVSVPTSTANAAAVFQLTVSDPEGDTLSYSVTTIPASGPFTVSSTGAVQTTSALSGETQPAYDLFISVNDGSSTVGPLVLTVKITGINSAPTFTNLPFSVTVTENVNVNTLVFPVSASDVNTPAPTLVYSTSFTSASGSTLFSIDTSTGQIKTSSSIDYEALGGSVSFIATVTVSDGLDTSNADLNITVLDDNDAPSFQSALYTLSGSEGIKGLSYGDPGFGVTDQDTGDTHTYSVDCYQISMNSASGVVSLAMPYDLDVSGTPNQFSCTVTVSDGELSGTTTLTINVNEVNNYSPVFGFENYTFYIQPSEAVGTTIGSIVATDSDIGTFGTLSYSLTQTVLGGVYFAVSSTGDVSVTADISSFGSGVTFLLSGTVTDGGGLSDTAYIVIVIQVITTQAITTTVPTDKYITFFGDGRNAAWMTCFFLTVLASLGILAYGGYRFDVMGKIRKLYQDWAEKRQRRKTMKDRKKKMSKELEMRQDNVSSWVNKHAMRNHVSYHLQRSSQAADQTNPGSYRPTIDRIFKKW